MENLVSLKSELIRSDEYSEMSSEQAQCLNEIRTWVQTEAKFYGRTDDEFLIIFLRGCEFNLETTKTTMDTYYNNRRTMPQWWTNRDLRDENLMAAAQLRTMTALIDKHGHQPTVVISHTERVGPNRGNFNDYCKIHTMTMEIGMRRSNCQMNGAIWIIDCRNYTMWFPLQLLKPTVIRDVVRGVYNGSPVRIQKIVFVDPPFLAYVAHKMCQPFLPRTTHQRICFCSRDSVSDHVDIELLPMEYGGQAGPMAQHDDAFLREMMAFNDYLVDDNKYGYRQ